ncbi:MAG TPA: hypothetical protein VH540_05930 [Ktedonobacterales bacterium]|jgi:hypothetical protein
MGKCEMRYRRRKLVGVKHVMRLGTGGAFKESLQALGFSGQVNTAFIERVNLTIRRGVRRWRAAPGRPRGTFPIWRPNSSGGWRTIILSGHTARCAL